MVLTGAIGGEMERIEPEKSLRRVVDACSDCDTCRCLMEDSCLLFPELYRLYDREKETGIPLAQAELRAMSEVCTLCGLCPCPDIRADVIRGKSEKVAQEGMPLRIRLLADLQVLGRTVGLAPRAANRLLALAPVRGAIKKWAGIHLQRDLPPWAEENFFVWARRQGLGGDSHQAPKVAYFCGCTAGYLFPQVARSAVGVLRANGVGVHVPPQQCCGMPTLLEGDEPTTLQRVKFNLESLLEAVEKGYEPVCSCPTCGYLLKVLLRENACYSPAYQEAVQAGRDEIKVPSREAGGDGFIRLKKSIYANILLDNRYFSSLDPLDRMALSEKVMDMGEYLNRLGRRRPLNDPLGRMDARMVYYAPCHQREQGIGSQYSGLLSMIPGLDVQAIGSSLDCCGMGGSLGYKAGFYDASVRLAAPLMQKIRSLAPDGIVTDCLSCRLQFQHLLPYPVHHPLEILIAAYKGVEVS